MHTTQATNRSHDATRRLTRVRVVASAHLCALLVAAFRVATGAQSDRPRSFATPEEAVRALVDAAKQGNLDLILAIFGPDGRELAATSDSATGRMNLKIFSVAAKERMRVDDTGPNRKTLVIGNEDWPFPVPLVKAAEGWRFDQDGIVFEKDLGSGTGAAAEKVTTYDPDKTWQPIR